MKVYSKESLIEALKAIRERGWIETQRKNNNGAVGHTLEDLLGIKENNLPLPNAAEWEIKAQKKHSTALVTLFHMEPSPRSFRFVSNILLPEFGWVHRNAGDQYPETEKSFRQTVHARGYSSRGFIVKLDRQDGKIWIRFDADAIDISAHGQWYQEVAGKSLNEVPYWGFDDLFHKAGTKLHNFFLVVAESKKINDALYFHYQDIFMLEKLSKDAFVDAVEKGYVYIDFDARTGHNHGTKFRLRSSALLNLYDEVRKY